MKNQLKRRSVILIVSFLLVMGISTFLNWASFDPNFSMMDAISGATKRSRRQSAKADTVTSWGYSAEDLALPDETAYTEETVDTPDGSYVLLQKTALPDAALVILSDKNNSDYAKAVAQVAESYENLGYPVEIREYSEIMMLSLAHAEHFDLFLLRKEDAS